MSDKNKSKNVHEISVLWAPSPNLANGDEVQTVFDLLADLMPTLSRLRVFM